MSNYTKTTNFTAKDALTTGDPNKVIKGSDHDTEFDNIATASATKSNKVISGVTNNVIKQSASGDLEDSGYSFSGLIGDVAITKAEADILDGATVTTAELNKLDGFTGTVGDLNIISGGVAAGISVAEFQTLNGVTSSIQTQLNSRLTSADIDDLSSVTNPTGARGNLEIGKYPRWWEYLGSGDDGAYTSTGADTVAKGEYHYTNLTISAGHSLSTTNASDSFLIIRCTGTATIAGTISLAGKGAAGGADGIGAAGDAGSASCYGGSGGGGGAWNGTGGAGGLVYNTEQSINGGAGHSGIGSGLVGAAVSTNSRLGNVLKHTVSFVENYSIGGAGGGGGSHSSFAAGNGGNGGGLIILIADTIDFQTGAIITSAGGAGTSANSVGGGGGGGGTVLLISKTVTNNGTVSVVGGAGGGGTWLGGAGGAGLSAVVTLT